MKCVSRSSRTIKPWQNYLLNWNLDCNTGNSKTLMTWKVKTTFPKCYVNWSSTKPIYNLQRRNERTDMVANNKIKSWYECILLLWNHIEILRKYHHIVASHRFKVTSSSRFNVKMVSHDSIGLYCPSFWKVNNVIYPSMLKLL